MKNFVQLDGNITMINTLLNTVVEPLCGFENAYEYEDLDDLGMIRLYPEHIPAVNFEIVLISLYHRLNDPLYSEVQCNCEMPEPDQNSTFRITCAHQQAQKRAEDFFIYNGINTDRFIQLECPIKLNGTSTRVEMIAIGLTDEELALLNKQGKTTVMANKVHTKIEKLGGTIQTTGRIMANDVVNPLAVAAAKTTATIVSAGAKTVVDCALAASNEILRDAAQFSVAELKERKEVKTMAYSLRKLMNKTQTAKSTNKTNNYSL